MQVKAKQLLQDLEQQAAGRLARAKQLADKGETTEAIDTVSELVRVFAGTQAATDGGQMLTSLAKKPEIKDGQRSRPGPRAAGRGARGLSHPAVSAAACTAATCWLRPSATCPRGPRPRSWPARSRTIPNGCGRRPTWPASSSAASTWRWPRPASQGTAAAGDAVAGARRADAAQHPPGRRRPDAPHPDPGPAGDASGGVSRSRDRAACGFASHAKPQAATPRSASMPPGEFARSWPAVRRAAGRALAGANLLPFSPHTWPPASSTRTCRYFDARSVLVLNPARFGRVSASGRDQFRPYSASTDAY